jgi:hypothetical protein
MAAAHGAGGERREVRLQRGELAHGRRRVGLLAALVELVDGQPADRRVVAQRRDGPLAIGVGCAKLGHPVSIVNA